MSGTVLSLDFEKGRVFECGFRLSEPEHLQVQSMAAANHLFLFFF